MSAWLQTDFQKWQAVTRLFFELQLKPVFPHTSWQLAGSNKWKTERAENMLMEAEKIDRALVAHAAGRKAIP